MNVLVWQWGRRGAGPRIAALLADACNDLPGVSAVLALPSNAEILQAPGAAVGGEPPRTPEAGIGLPHYADAAQMLLRALAAPLFVPAMARRLRRERTALAICAMPGPLDLLMAAALRLAGVRFAVIIHDAAAHPGDGYPLQYRLNHALVRRADAAIVLTRHVEAMLREQRVLRRDTRIIRASLPPLVPAPRQAAARSDGRIHVLNFGRLLPYKGLDLLADALEALGPRPGMEVRVVGEGPDSADLDRLRALPGVSVENRWVPEGEIGGLIGWADLVVLPYREASQSGVAATALGMGRHVLATRVGGLAEQLGGDPRATLCDPDPKSLAAALSGLLERDPADAAAPPDFRTAWQAFARRVVSGLARGDAEEVADYA